LITSVEAVRQHLAALASYDFPALNGSVSTNVELRLIGETSWKWELAGLYRFITQAWDFAVGDVQLADEGGGSVRVQIRFVNGDWVKDVEGQYQVEMGRISLITLTNATPTRA
jgi:ketosteroid isomerase-like protein